MPTVLITGASRGIGLEFARQYAADGWRVLACCRDPDGAEGLQRIAGGGVARYPLDVDDGASVAACRQAVGGQAIDVLINNAGVIGSRAAGLGSMDYEAFEACLKTNVLGPMRVTEAFVDLLAQGSEKKLVTISSRMGSITQTAPDAMIYRTSKAAVNMLTKCLSLQLRGKGITAVVVHPGWVRTDMGGASAALDPIESVTAMRRTIAGLALNDSGRFLNYDGSEIPW
jgi:NAD(P)-dependent dehydrogenase (short-subunit alcohol dehydrogenase family)